MKINLFKKLFIFCSMLISIIFVVGAFSGCSLFGKDKGYTVSGFVYDEFDNPVPGVKISSEMGEVLTDKNGEYIITNVKNGIIVSPSIEGYWFETESQNVSGETENLNFTAFQEYTLSGTVVYEGIDDSYLSRDDLQLEIVSLSGDRQVSVGNDGTFEVSGVAGQATITCYPNKDIFFPEYASIKKPNVTIKSMSSLTVNFDFDTDDIDLSKIDLYINGERRSVLEQSELFGNVYYKSKVELVSDCYEFSEKQFTVTALDQVKNIKAYKLYDISGKVKSGNTRLSSATIKVNGNDVGVKTDVDGQFVVSKLYGTNKITAVYGGLTFETVTVSSSSSEIVLNGTKPIYLNFDIDFEGAGEIKINHSNIKPQGNGLYILNNVCLGDQIQISSESYHLSSEMIDVTSENLYTISAEAYYKVNVSVDSTLTNLDGFSYLLGSSENDLTEVTANAFEKLFGTHYISASYSIERYRFDKVKVDYNSDNKTINLSYQVPYTAKISVRSGDIPLDATVTLNDKTYSVIKNEIKEIDDLYGNVRVVISSNGYNPATYTLSNDNCKISANLSYNLSGVVKTGKYAVLNANVTVSCGGSQIKSIEVNESGEFNISGLYGTNIISVDKNDYDFGEPVTVTSSISSGSNLLEIDGTYSIHGYLTDGNKNYLNNVKVWLIDQDDFSNTIDCITGEEKSGYYEFAGLNSVYMLLNDYEENGASLNPLTHFISAGGTYNFSLAGFKVSGTVYTGDIKVAYAKVTAYTESSDETLVTYTNAFGNYTFEILPDASIITVSLDGYTFEVNDVLVTEKNTALNFYAKYSVKGFAYSGATPINDALIYIDDSIVGRTQADGSYEIDGLEGMVSLRFEKDGFVFDNELEVSKHQSVNINCKAVLKVQVKTGDISVYGFSYNVDENLVTLDDESYEAEILANLGETITFSKDDGGYQIESLVVETYGTFIQSATYKISGKVASGNEGLSFVIIKVNDEVYQTNNNGEFTLTGLSGKVKISFSLEGSLYTFDSLEVEGYGADIVVNATYSVSGTVLIGNNFLAGVNVTLTDALGVVHQTTAENGNFQVEGVSGRYTLKFEKDTYDFDIVENCFDKTHEIYAYFSISGKILNGTLPQNVNVYFVKADGTKIINKFYDDGNFRISNLQGTGTIEIDSSDYKLHHITLDGSAIQLNHVFSDSVTELTLNLSFDVTFTFKAPTNTMYYGIGLSANGKLVTTTDANNMTFDNNGGSVTLRNLEGNVAIELYKKNVSFTLNGNPKILYENILKSVKYTVDLTVAYDISGRITAGGFALSNIKVSDGAVYTYTDGNGNYTLKNVAGSVKIDESNLQSQKVIEIKGNTEDVESGYYNFNISVQEAAYLLYFNAIDKLDRAKTVQMVGSGTVHGQAKVIVPINTYQNVFAMFKRDQNGNIVKQNMNQGDKVSLGITVDPNISLVIFGNKNTDSWKSQVVRDEDNVSLDNGVYSAKHTYSGFSNITSSASKTTYGSYPTGLYPYYVNYSNDSNRKIQNFKYDGTNYTFVMPLSTDKTEQIGYATQIAALGPSGTSLTSFSKLNFIVTINKDGWLTTLVSDEEYKINQTTDVSIDAKITYNFYANIDVGSLKIENQTQLENALKVSANKPLSISDLTGFDVVAKAIYG